MKKTWVLQLTAVIDRMKLNCAGIYFKNNSVVLVGAFCLLLYPYLRQSDIN